MDAPAQDDGSAETLGGLLDALRDRRDWDEGRREAQLSRMVERFPVDELREAVRARLGNLGGRDGEAVLRLAEAYSTPGLMRELARALIDQPDLAPDRAWEALSLLEGTGLIESRPELAERWDELAETFESDDALATLVEQLEEEPEGSWVALQGIGAVEPEVRAEIVAGLADFPTGPGLVAFLRLLAFAHEPTTRQSALDALAARADDEPEHRAAWASIALDHPDAGIRDRAFRRLGIASDPGVAEAIAGPGRPRPEPAGSLVTALDGSGRGTIVLASRDRGRWVVASFLCDVWEGVVEASGQIGDDPGLAAGVFEECGASGGRDVVEDAPGLAEGLLAGSLLLCGPTTNPVLRYWLERTAGPEFRARPFIGLFSDEDMTEQALDLLAEASWSILEACPDWVDRSVMTYDLAEEIALRSGEASPDPHRDAGAFRYLFEHRLVGRLEHYRRMLLWMASFWHASGDPDLARSALALTWQLSDPQHAVPGHPFTVALATRSLAAAQTDLRKGHDPRGKG